MYADRTKPKVDFSLCLGCIPAMLHKLIPVLSARQYRQLRKAVNTHADYRSKKACILRFSEEMAAQ